MNSTFMRINIAVTVVSLLYLLLLYFGYIRLFRLQTGSCEQFSKTYLKTPRAQSRGKLIVSMGTDKNHFSEIKLSLNSILDQTVHADQLILSVFKDSQIEIPQYLTDSKILIMHRLCDDYGDLMCLLSPLLREKDGEAKIILLTDKQIYGEDFIETLVDASEQSPNSVIFTSGYNGKKSLEKGGKVSTPYSNDVIDMSGGVLIKPKFFQEDIFSLENSPNGIHRNPDVFLSSYLHKQGVKFTEISYKENFRKMKELLPGSDKAIGYYAALFPSFN
jgi:hypothetical protein